MGEEEVKVDSHSMDENGNIEEYYVGEHTLKASEVTVTKIQEHGHPKKKKKK